jgi:hypothetical protein
MFDSINAVKEKVVNHFDKQEVTYTKKNFIIDTCVGIASTAVLVALSSHDRHVAVGTFAALLIAGNFAKGTLAGMARVNRKVAKLKTIVPKLNNIRNILNEENLQETFVVQFYTAGGKPIFSTAKPIYTYINALAEGSEGLENIERATSFNIEKYYSRKGDE